MSRRIGGRLIASWLTAVLTATGIASADPPWIEVRSPHFVVVSNASDASTRSIAWQLEQIRSTIAAIWPWARVDLNTPLLVLAVKDEAGMKQLAPSYWEGTGALRPASVWVAAADRYYLAIRADVRGDDTNVSNPHRTAYFAYASMVLTASFDARLPIWFLDGLAGVLSNTVVRDTHVYLGPPIGEHIRRLNQSARLSLAQLVSVAHDSREMIELERRLTFEAQSWAFLHFLMFGDKGAHQGRLNQLTALLHAGRDPGVALREAIGRLEDYETPLSRYIGQNLYAYTRASVDAAVKRESFAVRALAPAESAASRAAFHVAMERPAEAAAEIAAARKADPAEPESHVAEGLQLDRDGKRDEAKAAFGRAVERGSSNPYAYFRFAVLSWGDDDPGRDVLLQIERSLTRATALNNRYAAAYAYLGEARAALKERTETAIPVVRRAISLEPSEPHHRLMAARVWWRLGNLDDAVKEAQAALALSQTGADRAAAERLLAQLDRARRPGLR